MLHKVVNAGSANYSSRRFQPEVGDQYGSYRLIEELGGGQGAYNSVFLAEDISGNASTHADYADGNTADSYPEVTQYYVIKFPKSQDPTIRQNILQRMTTEKIAYGGIDHDYIPTFRALVDETTTEPGYIVIRQLKGYDLGRATKQYFASSEDFAPRSLTYSAWAKAMLESAHKMTILLDYCHYDPKERVEQLNNKIDRLFHAYSLDSSHELRKMIVTAIAREWRELEHKELTTKIESCINSPDS